MDIKGLQDILQNKLPQAMKSFNALESSLTPLLSQVAMHKDKMSDEHKNAFDKAMNDIAEAKKQMRQHAD
jgi:hypothetical protein